ncbi:hypothetical protein Tco_1003864 [Tanacetum coccineum]|uniref:Uncharacterized protein n=1 Tax=Tanacetum coccineum TaxID=301880 RepID=A0ABQ5FA98_9ASTR
MKCVWLPESIGVLGGSRLTTSDKEVTKQDLLLKGGDRGACKLLGDVMVMLERTTMPILLDIVRKGYDRRSNSAVFTNKSNTQSPLLQKLARAADSHDIKDQLSVLFEREVIKDRQNMQSYYMISNKLREAVRMREGYFNELQTSNNSNKVANSIEIMRRMQVDDIQMASRLMLTAKEMKTKVHEKTILLCD